MSTSIDEAEPAPGGRWFVSVEPPEPVRQDLATIKTPASGIRWTPPHQFHLTLRFMGEADPDTVRRLAEGLATVRVEPFIIATAGVGRFPAKGHARVLWAGFGSGHPRLFQLHRKIEEAVVAAGIEPDDRRFHPHVTLGRCGRATPGAVKEFLKTHRDHAGVPFRVETFSLFVSHLTPEGAEHTPVRAYPLAGDSR